MVQTVNGTLEYVISLTSHVPAGDVPGAVLTLLAEMGFHAHMDGFYYLRKAICLRCDEPDMRMSSIYQEIVMESHYAITCEQVEQAIMGVISNAWRSRNREIWGYFFCGMLGKSKPSNKVFVSRIACFMELWRGCC